MEGLASNPNEKCEDKNMDSNLNILESSQNDEFPLKVTSALTRPFPVQTKNVYIWENSHLPRYFCGGCW